MNKKLAAALIALAMVLGIVIGGHLSFVKEAQARPGGEVGVHIDRTTRVACYYTDAGISCVNVTRLPGE